MGDEQKWLRKAAVARRYDVDQSTVTRWSNKNSEFPKPVQISPGVTAWNRDQLDEHDRKKLRASGG